MSCPPQPALVFVPAACPRCGARNTDEADRAVVVEPLHSAEVDPFARLAKLNQGL